MYSRQLVVLVGGRGTRLGNLARSTPKPLMPITDDTVFLDYFLAAAVRQGFSEVLLLAGHFGDQVQARYNHRRIGGAHVSVLIEPEAKGTGGAFAFARDHLASTFIAANGDTLFDINIRAIDARLHADPGLLGVMALRTVENAGRYGSVQVDESGTVLKFSEKESSSDGKSGLINGGIYALRRTAIDLIDTLPCSIETDIFPQLAQRGQLAGLAEPGYFLDIGLPETLEQARQDLPQRKRPVLFLDRDGVLNHDHGYVNKIEDWTWIPGAVDVIRAANTAGYAVVVVTNQAGIGRGYYDESDMERLHRWVQTQLHSQGAFVDAFYYSPFHPDAAHDAFRITSPLDRKPNPNMLLRALRQLDLKREGSFLIGDQPTDIEAAQAAGIEAFRFEGGNLRDWLAGLPVAKYIL